MAEDNSGQIIKPLTLSYTLNLTKKFFNKIFESRDRNRHH